MQIADIGLFQIDMSTDKLLRMNGGAMIWWLRAAISKTVRLGCSRAYENYTIAANSKRQPAKNIFQILSFPT